MSLGAVAAPALGTSALRWVLCCLAVLDHKGTVIAHDLQISRANLEGEVAPSSKDWGELLLRALEPRHLAPALFSCLPLLPS